MNKKIKDQVKIIEPVNIKKLEKVKKTLTEKEYQKMTVKEKLKVKYNPKFGKYTEV